MTNLQKTFGLMLLTAAPFTAPAYAQLQPQDLATQQSQTQSQLNQQSTQTQLNNLQQQQNMAQDRAREQQLFTPQPYGAAAPYVPPPPPRAAPPPPPPPAPPPRK